jgi:hypothetical protein
VDPQPDVELGLAVGAGGGDGGDVDPVPVGAPEFGDALGELDPPARGATFWYPTGATPLLRHRVIAAPGAARCGS